MSQPKDKGKRSKKANKNETEGNILAFYALQSASASVLKSKVSPIKITFKSPTKAQVQYSYDSSDGVLPSKDEKIKIQTEVNKMLTSKTKVSCSDHIKNTAGSYPSGINTDTPLCDVAIDGHNVGVSHVPIQMEHLGLLSDFKLIKFNYKASKSVLDIFYSFKLPQNQKKNASQKKGKIAHQTRSYFEDEKSQEKDDRMTFSKEIIELVLNDLKVQKINPNDLDTMLAKVHDVMNQFQSISYSKGYKAACYKK